MNSNIKIAVLLGTIKHTLDVSTLPKPIQVILTGIDPIDKEELLLKALVLSTKYDLGCIGEHSDR